ncbi:nuclear transport factor 2 family protein [Nocardia beijingensis]|uniref:Nuclear transport factor 2 family protein n=1 Tax=Nocardia beijingensis TaxID=95162 RepID=A0ABW7W939_9NOCA
MSSTPDQATRDLAENWVKALTDIDLFIEISHDDCLVWHSADDKWVTVRDAVAAVYERSGDGAVPTFVPGGVTFTEHGFFNECTTQVTIGGQEMKLHLLQIVDVRDGKAARVREYIGPEMGVQP